MYVFSKGMTEKQYKDGDLECRLVRNPEGMCVWYSEDREFHKDLRNEWLSLEEFKGKHMSINVVGLRRVEGLGFLSVYEEIE